MSNTTLFTCDNASRDSLDPFWKIEVKETDFSESVAGSVISIIAILLLLVGLPWNTLLIVIIIKKHLYKQPAVMLMLNLAIANLLTGLFVLPFNVIVGFTGEYAFGDNDHARCWVCQTGILLTLMPTVAVHMVALMSVDRLLYLKKPLAYPHIVTPARMFVAVVVVWVVSVALSILPLAGIGTVLFSSQVATCILFSEGNSRFIPNIYYTIAIVLESSILVTIQFIMYIWILLITRKYLFGKLQRKTRTSGNASSETSNNAARKEHSRNQLHLVRVFGAIFTANLVTWIPVVISALAFAIALPITGSYAVPPVIFTITYILWISRTAIHPIVEALLTSEIRETLSKYYGYIITRVCKRSDGTENVKHGS